MNSSKRLYKSNDAVFAGVCGGIAEYLELDPTLIRILAVFLVLAGFGIPILAYIIAMIVMPKRSDDFPTYIDVQPTPTQTYVSPETSGYQATEPAGAAGYQATESAGTSGYQATESAGTSGYQQAQQVSQEQGTQQTTADQADSATSENPVNFTTAANFTYATGASTVMPDQSFEPPDSAHSYQTPQNTTQFAAQGAPQYTTQNATPPGTAYTTSNPEAYDATPRVDQMQAEVKPHRGLRAGIIMGILLVGVGMLALFGTFLNVSAWRFWPLIIVVFGLVILCTPGYKGWSLSRAGNGISTISVGIALLLWTLGIVSGSAFWQTLVYLWPVLLIIIGLSIIGTATKQSAFKLFGSLLFSITLLVGMWSFGQIGGQDVDINLPGGRKFSITIPAPDLFSSDGVFNLQDITILFDR